jgi:WD40 repeat protein/mono/diheme cytochrome c family protein
MPGLRLFSLFILAAACAASAAAPPKQQEKEDPNAAVSYFKKIRPIFQANCQGCHQPAKAKGDYVMTDFARLVAGGEDAKKDGKVAVAPGNPDKSNLFTLVTPVNGEAEMPKKKQPLLAPELELIRRWIAEGAKDDTPPNARQRYDQDHPPVYAAPAVITSIDFSPDGTLLAVAGFHEVLLWKSDGSALAGRLVGISERVQTVRFSPDGKLLAAAAGRPAQMGEIQIWDVARKTLVLSVPQGYDTLYGVSWSPDGQQLAFGCPDNSVRAIDAATGKQTMLMASHSDWPLDTAWSVKGDHIISVSRDMSVKLTELASARFVDNITSITPGALRGGMNTVARNPKRDEIMIGGADGTPQIYRIFRTTARKIGDNSNLLRRFPVMEGRVYSVSYAADGKRCAAGSSLDGKGQIDILESESDEAPPAEVLKIMSKTVLTQTEAEKKQLDDYFTNSVKRLSSFTVPGGVYSVVWNQQGTAVAAAGEDGHVRLVDVKAGKIVKEFVPVPLSGAALAQEK